MSLTVATLLTGCGGGGSTSTTDAGTTIDTGTTPIADVTYKPYDAAPISEEDKTAYLDAINAERAQVRDCGTYGVFQPAQPLTWSDELYRAAAEHSYDMSIVGETSETFSHIGSGGESDWTAQVLGLNRGSEFWERTKVNGYDKTGKYPRAENAHASPETIDVAMEDFMLSDGHCAAIMDPAATQVGVAVAYNPASTWGYYWTQVFGGVL